MLIISRKKGEKLHIGRDITITILDLRAGRVRLGIDAPEDCRVQRDFAPDAESSERRRNKDENP